MTQRILVWDLPTRIFHWSLALSFAGAFLTASAGGADRIWNWADSALND